MDYELIGRIVADLQQSDDFDNYCNFFPRFEHAPDLQFFQKQSSDLPSVETEWIHQGGGGDWGISGTMAYPIGGEVYLIFNYNE